MKHFLLLSMLKLAALYLIFLRKPHDLWYSVMNRKFKRTVFMYLFFQYALSNEPQCKAFDPAETAVQPYQDQSYQPVYFVSWKLWGRQTQAEVYMFSQTICRNFFTEVVQMTRKHLLLFHRQYSSTIHKPFSIRYDPYTCSMEVLDEPSKIQNALAQMRDDLKILHKALERLGQK